MVPPVLIMSSTMATTFPSTSKSLGVCSIVWASILVFSRYENSQPISAATSEAREIAPLSGLRMKSGLLSIPSRSAISGMELTNFTGTLMSARTFGSWRSRMTIPSHILPIMSAITRAETASPGEKRLSCLA